MRIGSTSRPRISAPSGRGKQTWSPPYSLPSAGQVVAISTNFASSVKPTTHSSSEWNEPVFGGYSGGALVEDYSRAGAWVIAGSGGHNESPNIGACIFDFTDATWKRLDNANGVPNQNDDFVTGEVDTDFNEILAAGSPTTSTGCPAPAHLYAHVFQLKSSQGGGPKGSCMRILGQASLVDSSAGTSYAHAIDLSTGLWTRKTTNGLGSGAGRVGVYDPVTRRWYKIQQLLNNGLALKYIDEADWTWKNDSISNPGDIGNTFGAFVDQARRLLVLSTSNEAMYAANMDNITALTELTLSGSLPNGNEQYQWMLYPPDGCFYRFSGSTTTATIEKLKPPATDPLSNAWVVGTVNLGTALTKQPQAFIDSGAIHHNRFFYVPFLGCFAWIPGGDEPVVLLRPPNS